MHLLDMEKSIVDEDPVAGASHLVTGTWDPTQPQFVLLNTETPKGKKGRMLTALPKKKQKCLLFCSSGDQLTGDNMMCI